MDDIYEPREDSYLLLDQIKKYSEGKTVLDIGTGSGILALGAALKAESVLGVDVNQEAVRFAKDTAEASGFRNVEFKLSDLFSKVKGKFDLVIFNPPYLPYDKDEPKSIRLATTGGKKGYELIERFFSSVSSHLWNSGKILILFSTLTGREKVHSIMEEKGFRFQKLAEESFFGETLFVYLAEKSEFLTDMESKGIENISKMTQGHRGEIYTGDLDGKKVAIKKKREDSAALGRMINEARWLKVLNRRGIGPEIIDYEEDYFIYNYVEGVFIPDFIVDANKKDIKNIFSDVLQQCFIMDKMSANKEEMHNPYKHIVVNDKKAVLLDFERMHIAKTPKNVTQFIQYITSSKMKRMLEPKSIRIDKKKMISAGKDYKKDMKEKNLDKIIRLITL